MARSIVRVLLACLAGLVLVGLLIAAVSPADAQAHTRNSPDLPIKTYFPLIQLDFSGVYHLNVWHEFNESFQQEFEKILGEYQAGHLELSIELVQKEDLTQALSDTIPTGGGPDLIFTSNDRIGTYSQKGFIVSLDAWLASNYLANNFEPAPVKGMMWNSHTWGIPLLQEGIALVYNKTLISTALLPVQGNYPDLQAKAMQFQAAHPGKYYLCNQGLGGIDAYHAAPVYFGHGMDQYGGYLDEAGQVYMTSTESLAAANWIAGFRVLGPAETSHGICRDMLVKGQAGIWWTGPWAIADLESAGVDFGIAPMNSPFVGIKNIMLAPGGVNHGQAERAVSLMKYLGSPEVQARLANDALGIPVNTMALNSDIVKSLETIKAFGDALHSGVPMGATPYSVCQWGPVADATKAIWNGAQIPQAAMEAAQAEIEDCIASMAP